MFITLWNFVKFLGVIILILLLFAIIYAIIDVIINDIYMNHVRRKMMNELSKNIVVQNKKIDINDLTGEEKDG